MTGVVAFREPQPLTGPGWPRPVIGGWPIPWVSPPADLANADYDRLQEVIAGPLCQVCGLGHDPGARVFVCVSAENEGTARDVKLADIDVRPMDDAVMHERCARLAVGRCPALRDPQSKGVLLVLSAPVEAVFAAETDGINHLVVRGVASRFEV